MERRDKLEWKRTKSIGEIIVDAFITMGRIIVLFCIFGMIKERWEYIKMEEDEYENRHCS